MNSPSASSTSGADQEPDDDLDGFDDFTIASSWEKVIAAVEATAREWQATGSSGLLVEGAVPVVGSRSMHRIHKEISFGKKPYVVILFFHIGNEIEIRDEWPIGLHHLQLWFGVKDFVVVAPVSPSGVILDAPEATTVLSTVAIALSSCGSDWPAFVPVHDPTRKAYKGIQGTKSTYSISFEADRIGSWVPVRFMHLEGLYELFASKVAFTAASSAAVPSLKVEFTMRLTYRTPMFGFEYHNQGGASPTAEAKGDYDGESPDEPAWDEDLPWGEWHSVDDPIKGFELVAIWNNRFVSNSWEMAEYENASTFNADKWSLIPVFPEKKEDNQKEQGFAGRLEALVKAFGIAGEAQFMDEFANVVKPDMDLLLETFTVPPPSVLDRVLKDLFYEAVTPTGEGFSFKTSGTSIKGAPQDSLFGRFCLQALRFGSCNIRAISELWLEFVREVRWCWDECQPLPRVSPDESPDLSTCLMNQKLQLLAVCIKLKAEDMPAKTTFSDNSEVNGTDSYVGEAMSSKDAIGNKNLERSRSQESQFSQTDNMDSGSAKVLHETAPALAAQSSQDEMESLLNPPPQDSSEDEMESLLNPPPQETKANSQMGVPSLVRTSKEDKEHTSLESNTWKELRTSLEETEAWPSSDDEPWEPLDSVDVPIWDTREERRGSAGPVKHLMLLKVERPLHAPNTQRAPIMTEDMLLEREQAIAALSKSPSERVACMRLQTELLSSDMSAFKAANPGAVFEDFVRWHSPRDWLVGNRSDDGEISGARNVEDSEANWPPKGRLSNRMSQPGNLWSEIWEQIVSEPAHEQKPLFDYQREGEKVMHYLDTLMPQQLLAQMICTAFMACADALKRTKTGDLPRLCTEIEELYSSMDIILQPLINVIRANLPSQDEVDACHKDLLQLCAVFGKVENDVFMAASLFQKLKLAPTLITALFNSFLDDGERLTCARVESTTSHGSWKEGSSNFNNDREVVAELFPLSSTSQSVGKSLRMGNFLNGNEPDVREVKFHCYEEDLCKKWPRGSAKERKSPSKMFSHRMYVSGTANDMEVALSVISRD